MARVDSCFKSQRIGTDYLNDRTYWYNLPVNRNMNFKEPVLPSSVQYTSTRIKNSDFNPPFYGKSSLENIRRDLDPDWEVKQYTYRPSNMDSLVLGTCGRVSSRLTDPQSIQTGQGNMTRQIKLLTPEQFASVKTPMPQPSGKVIW